MSHLCTMHRPPLSKERTGGDYIWGEDFMQGGEDTHLAPSKHRQHLSLSLHPCDGGGGEGTPFEERAPSTSLPSFSRRRRSSALIPPQVYVGETHNTSKESPAVRWPIFRSKWPHSRSFLRGGSDQRPEDGALLHLWSAPQSELRVLVPAHLRKRLHTQVIDSELDLIIFSVGVLVTGSLEWIVTRQVVKVAHVAPMKCIYELCLVYNYWKKKKQQAVSSAKGCHRPF